MIQLKYALFYFHNREFITLDLQTVIIISHPYTIKEFFHSVYRENIFLIIRIRMLNFWRRQGGHYLSIFEALRI